LGCGGRKYIIRKIIMSFLKKFWDKVTNTERVQVRARNKKGRYVADDKSTPDVNEAYTTKRVKKSKK
jgi:hypothetical protein